MNGYADFIYTPYGWRCVNSHQMNVGSQFCNPYKRYVTYGSLQKMIFANGYFKQIPKPGQYCKRPDLLIDWSKS